MELKFSSFSTFLDAVQSITYEKLQEAKKLLQTIGKDIESIDDIFINNNNELFELLPDGSLVRVNLYIATKPIENRYKINTLNGQTLYKYHIYQCTTISQMINSGRKHRYKINNREDGTFFYTFTDFRGRILETRENQKLNICKNCLKKFLQINYANDYDVINFKLKKFYQQESSFFDFDTSTMEKGEYAKANVYTRNWTQISNQIKIKHDYSCEECGFKPNDTYQKRFIHTHHQNGDKQNNSEDNLKVLCIQCHAKVDIYHTRIKSFSDYKEFLTIHK